MRTKKGFVAVAAAAAVVALFPAAASAAFNHTQTFLHTGSVQTFTVPASVTSLHVTAQGASGGSASTTVGKGMPGLGGVLVADVPVTPGEVLKVHVGGQGESINLTGFCNTANANAAGGDNGGGAGGKGGASTGMGAIGGSGGGGATDLRATADTAGHRLVAAGGGGGAPCNGTVAGGDAGTNSGGGSDGGAPASGPNGGPGKSGGNGGTGGSAGASNNGIPSAGGNGSAVTGAGGAGGDGAGDATAGGGGGGGWAGGGGGGGGGHDTTGREGGAGAAGSSGVGNGVTVDSNSTAQATGDGKLTIEWNLRQTSTTLDCGGQVQAPAAAQCTATVADVDGGTAIRPGGTVTFSTDSTGNFTSTTCTLPASGANECSVNYTPGVRGTHHITAAYGGDSVHDPSQQTVALESVTTKITCADTTLQVGATTTCTGFAPPSGTGQVAFTTDSEGTFDPPSCTVPGLSINNSCASNYTPSAVGSGTHTLTATHQASANPGTTTITVTKTVSATSVACAPAAVGVATTCTAKVTGAGDRPSGTVTFSDDGHGTVDPSCTLPSTGTDQCTVQYTPTEIAGAPQTVSAAYAGDANHTASGSDGGVTVAKGSAPATLDCTPATVAHGAPITCTATVAGPGARASGDVSFTSDTAGSFSPASCTLPATGTDACSVSYVPDAVGADHLQASYPGDADYSATTSGETVNATPRSTATALSCSPASILLGGATTCTATVSDTDAGTAGRPTGTVTFASDSLGGFAPSCTLPADGADQCSVTYTPSAVGSGAHGLSAHYAGDSSFAASDGHQGVTVAAASVGPPRTPSGNPPTVAPTVRATISHRRVRLVKGRASIALLCHGSKGTTCKGTIKLAKTTSFSIAAGKTKVLRVPISARTKATLKKHKTAKVTVTLAIKQASGTTTTTKVKLTLVR